MKDLEDTESIPSRIVEGDRVSLKSEQVIKVAETLLIRLGKSAVGQVVGLARFSNRTVYTVEFLFSNKTSYLWQFHDLGNQEVKNTLEVYCPVISVAEVYRILSPYPVRSCCPLGETSNISVEMDLSNVDLVPENSWNSDWFKGIGNRQPNVYFTFKEKDQEYRVSLKPLEFQRI